MWIKRERTRKDFIDMEQMEIESLHFAGNRSKLDCLLSDDFLEYGQSGRVYNKSDTIDAFK